MTAIQDTPPLPAALMLPDGDPEPVPEEALDWLGDRMGDEPEWSIEQALASAEVEADDPAWQGDGLAVLARWQIDGPGSAEWAMRKLAATEAEGDEVAAQADAWVAEIERWRDARLRPLVARSAFFTEHLTRYLRALREADPRKKSLPLPSGTIQSRTIAPKVELVDEAAAMAWLGENLPGDEYAAIVKTVQSVRLTEFKKAMTVDAEAGVVRHPDSGMPVPGVVLHPGGVSFSVKVG